MEPFIKVCGVRNGDEALGAALAGANTIGLLMGLTHLAEDGITPQAGKKIVAALPDTIRTVMVTHLLDAGEIASIAGIAGVGAVQIHDDLPVEEIIKLRGLMPAAELIKTVHVTGEEAIGAACEYEPYVDMILLDSRTADRLGGTGMVHDWAVSRAIVERVSVPVILAGGLNPDNINRAIAEVAPAGIDANSGLEHPDGSKDFEKIRLFAQAGKNCRYNKTG
ncbi:MAG: phosphoribosylanthranilate isomerase [Micavibrio sp.]